MSTLVYVHGTNGSGKSTLARAVIAAGGGVAGVKPGAALDQKKAVYSQLQRGYVVLAGKYGAACGGVDGVQPFETMHSILRVNAAFNRRVLAEGLVTPGKDTCVQFASYFEQAVFILLDTPDTVCIQNVLHRRSAKGNSKPYDPKNLYRKQTSARNWADRLEQAGLVVERLHYRQARTRVLQLLGLPEPSIETLLSERTAR